MKRRIPKSPARAARRRAQLEAAGEYKRALRARDGSQGAASDVRRIDPATGAGIETIPADRR
jgi:hypothetical protein